MSRIVQILLLSLCLLPIQALAAGDECVRQAIADKLGLTSDAVEIGEAIEQPLYIALGSDLANGDRLTFEVRRDGVSYLSEEVELIADEGAASELDLAAVPVVELLSSLPSQLSMLRKTAAEGRIEVAILRNGTLLRTQPLTTLDRASQQLADGAIAPHALRSTLRIEPEARPHQKNACSDACNLEYDDCIYYRCEPQGGIACYESCYDLFLDCLEYNCSICQPSSSSTTTYSTVSTTPTSVYECHTSNGAYPKGIYRLYDRQIKKTVTTTTINSDCSQTVTTQVSYFNVYCWVYQYADAGCFSLGSVSPC